MDDARKIKSEQRRMFMLEGNLTKVIFVTALPQVVTMLIDALYNMADTFFVSQLGSAATAAVGVNDSLMMLIRSVSIGFGMGAASYISRSLGAKKDEEASRAATTNLFTCVGFLALLAVLGSIFLLPLVNFLGATDTVRPYSMEYARWILISAPITGITVCLSQTLRAEGSTTYAMIGSVSGCVINVILDPIFISVMDLGVAGAAIATGISKVISAIILFSPFIRRKCVISIKFKYFTPTKALYGEIARMGVPTMIRASMMSLSIIVINNVAANFGDAAMAAVSISNKSMRFVASAVMGFGQGFQPIAGYSWGAKRYDRVLKAFLRVTIIGAAIATILAILLGIFARETIEIFSKDAEVIDMGIIFITTQCFVLPMHMWVMIASGLFQALGKAVKAAIMGLSRQLVALVPAVIILSYFFGTTGLASSQAAADIISFAMALCLVLPTIGEIKKLIRAKAAEGKSADESNEGQKELKQSVAVGVQGE